MRWAALLKGMNIGSKKLPVAELRAVAEALGLESVGTLLASGNVVFTSAEKSAARLERSLEEALAEEGLETHVLVRNASEIRKVIDANPFPAAAKTHPNHLLVVFHREPVPPAPLQALRIHHHGPERVTAVGRELYIDYPQDVGHSKLPQSMRKAKFPELATARNWNTVNKLAALLE